MVNPAIKCVYFQAVILRSGLMDPVRQSKNKRQRHSTERETARISDGHIGNAKL